MSWVEFFSKINKRPGTFIPDSRVGKRLDKKATVNFKIFDVTNSITDSYNTCIARYIKK